MNGQTPFVGLGSTLAFATVVAPSVFTTLAGATGVTFSGDKVATEKTTNLQSTNGVDTYIAATQEPGSVDTKCQYLPGDASQIALAVIRDAKVPVNFQVTWASGNRRTFSGIVESITPGATIDKVAMIDVKVKITGPIADELS